MLTCSGSAASIRCALGPSRPKAPSLYSAALGRGRRAQLWAALTGASRSLVALSAVESACSSGARGCARVRSVPLGRIRGSAGRCTDFDRGFNPVQSRTAHRWLGVLRARQQGLGLPPVDLIQVGDVFFVQDGHHRISVARALGEQEIEAEVTVWEVTGPLPWDSQKAMKGGRRRGASAKACHRRGDGKESHGRAPPQALSGIGISPTPLCAKRTSRVCCLLLPRQDSE